MFNKIKNLFKGIKTMAKINEHPFAQKAPAEILEALNAYKKQNPTKYEAKKEKLFAKYGLVNFEPTIEVSVQDDIKEEVIKKNKKTTE